MPFESLLTCSATDWAAVDLLTALTPADCAYAEFMMQRLLSDIAVTASKILQQDCIFISLSFSRD